MKIILDECVPTIVKLGLPNRDIVTVQEMGWAGTKNGDLLRLAESAFDVFVTSDKNIRHQQNLAAVRMAFILLPTNQVPVIKTLLPMIDEAIDQIGNGDFVEI